MSEWKNVEAHQCDDDGCRACRVRARLVRALVAVNPQTTAEIDAVIAAVVLELPLDEAMAFVRLYLTDEVNSWRRQRRSAAASTEQCH